MKKIIALAVLLITTLAGWFLISRQPVEPSPLQATNDNIKLNAGFDSAAIPPLPLQSAAADPAIIDLGKKLFSDPILSRDNSISCDSCHQLSTNGTDNEVVSTGVEGRRGKINSPTVFNSRFNLAQFWDGRAETLEQQIPGPIHNPVEMDSNWNLIIARLSQRADYAQAFSAAYSDGITRDNIIDAIARFERTLVTPNSRFDQFLRGDQNALNAREQKGYALFREYGCISCHQGINIGGNLFQKFGAVKDYFKDKKTTPEDLGRFNVTHKEQDKFVFKVPGLRNIALTSPYLHNGSTKKLTEVIRIMGLHQLGREIPDEDIALIEAFLQSLTGNWQGKPLQ